MPTVVCRAQDPAACRYHGTALAVSDPAAYLAYKELSDADAFGQVAEAELKDMPLGHERMAALRAITYQQEAMERSDDWADHGFQHPGQVRIGEDWIASHSRSAEQLDALTDEQKAALKFFTSNNYEWVNKELYTPGTLPEGSEADRHFLTYSTDMNGQEVEENPTRKQVEGLTTVLDAALEGEAEEARILYRGKQQKRLVSFPPGTFDGKTHAEMVEAYQAGMDAYVAENYPVGGVVEMPGYVSTSAAPVQALAYASKKVGKYTRDPGVFFEMKTKKGKMLSGSSAYSRENEVLLPRNTRWKVVAVHKDKDIQVEAESTYNTKQKAKVTLVQMVEID